MLNASDALSYALSLIMPLRKNFSTAFTCARRRAMIAGGLFLKQYIFLNEREKETGLDNISIICSIIEVGLSFIKIKFHASSFTKIKSCLSSKKRNGYDISLEM